MHTFLTIMSIISVIINLTAIFFCWRYAHDALVKRLHGIFASFIAFIIVNTAAIGFVIYAIISLFKSK